MTAHLGNLRRVDRSKSLCRKLLNHRGRCGPIRHFAAGDAAAARSDAVVIEAMTHQLAGWLGQEDAALQPKPAEHGRFAYLHTTILLTGMGSG